MKATKITKHILHIDFPTQRELTLAFMRVEDDGFPWEGRPFTVGEFRQHYSEQHGGWTYEASFQGVCVDAENLREHIDGLFDPLLFEEEQLVDAVRYRIARPLMLVGTYEGGHNRHRGEYDPVIDHELAHALFATDPTYRRAARAQTRRKGTEVLRHYLLSKDYDSSCIDDEAQAYLIGSHRYLESRGVPYPREIREALIGLRDKALTKAEDENLQAP